MKLPLGEAEDLNLEFKRKDVLDKPQTLARSVASMLNGEGGNIWVGIQEENGKAVSAELIDDLDRRVDKLQNALVDLINPSPIVGKDVQFIRETDTDAPRSNEGLLRIRVKAGSARPYVLGLQSGGRIFPLRTGSRTREMTLDELRTAFRDGESADDALRAQQRAVETELNGLVDKPDPYGPKGDRLTVLVRPAQEIQKKWTRANLVALIREPALTNNRLLGWSFRNPYVEQELKVSSKGYRYSVGKMNSQALSVADDGAIRFAIDLSPRAETRARNVLYPFALVEFPTSVLRLARVLYGQFSERHPAEIVGGLSLVGGDRWTLMPGSPHAHWHHEDAAHSGPSVHVGRPTAFSWAELEQTPDRCAYQLYSQLYRDFGFEPEDAVPPEYNRETGQLVIPD